MDEPPSERPPPPPKSYVDSTGYRTDDELMSERNRSRATVREIPIQRSLSAFGPSITSAGVGASSAMPSSYIPYNQGGTTTHWATTRYDPVSGQPQQEEYYRREVLTRTLVTRSTEALSAPPPLSRSSPVDLRPLPSLPPRDEVTVEYRTKYQRNVQEEERRIKENQDKRRAEEEEYRRQEERRRLEWENVQREQLEKIRRETEIYEKELHQDALIRQQKELERIERDREARRQEEERRRREWQALEDHRRRLEEEELAKRRRLEELEKERLAKQREEAERLERERIERERQRLEQIERQRLEKERIEKERIEHERLEIERIERIRREKREKEEKEKERQRQEAERLAKQRAEAERAEKERLEIERIERETRIRVQREAEERERERREEELRERRRREEELLEKQRIKQAQLEAEERERIRLLREKDEQDRLEAIRRQQERLEYERLEAEKREQQRLEDERRERELLQSREANQHRRNQERLAEEQREKERKEEERRAAERRHLERLEAQERERLRLREEEEERQRLAPLHRTAAERQHQRELEKQRERERDQLAQQAREIKEAERREQERRERERVEEQLRLQQLAEEERRNREKRDRERADANAREALRQEEDRKSRDHLDQIVRERVEKESWEIERKKLLQEHEAMERRRQALTSKETLEKLTRQPYYSRENLSGVGLSNSQPEITTKVERQVIERVDRTLYTGEESRYPSVAYPPSAHDTADDITGPSRRYDANTSRDDDWRRGASNRISKYKQKAKRDFFNGDSSQDPHYRTEDYAQSSSANPPPYPRVGPSPYDQEFRRLFEKAQKQLAHYRQRLQKDEISKSGILETDVDQQPSLMEDMSRSKSVLDYGDHLSRRPVGEITTQVDHTRSKSADYLMDKKLREDMAIPENELQKTADGLHRDSAARLPVAEYSQNYRSSREQISISPTYYQNTAARLPSQTTPTDLGYSSRPYSRTQLDPYPLERQRQPSGSALRTSPIGGISFPAGMFDRYKHEIEDMRRSRSSLAYPAPTEHTKESDYVSAKPSSAYTREEYNRTNIRTVGRDRSQAGYTVSTIPSSWNIYRDANSRVIEVADTFQTEQRDGRYGGRVTIEEVLDAIFQNTKPSDIAPDPNYAGSQPPPQNIDGPGIYTTNYNLMDKVVKEPHVAEHLLQNEPLVVRCTNCHSTRSLPEARLYYVSCKHCYTYYCSRSCRLEDWNRHKDRCSFARINTLCKEVIMKVRNDPETQYHMSKVARDGYRREGRGSVNIRLLSAHSAQMYLRNGWSSLIASEEPDQLLFYYPIQSLVEQRKEPSLIQLCRKYIPSEKFILSVSIIADIEQCPQTPPPETDSSRYAAINKPLRNPALGAYDRHGALVPTDV